MTPRQSIASEIVRRLSLVAVRPVCPICGSGSERDRICGWCAERLYENHSAHSSGSGAVAGPASAPVDGVLIHSPFLHAGSARDLAILLKFHGRKDLGRTAADLILGSGCPLPGSGSVVVPLPLCSGRLAERGYNQAEAIAAALAKACGVPVAHCLSRSERPPQLGLDASERRSNVRGSFHPGRQAVGSSPIWLVDDVMTTGSTIDEAVRTLAGIGGEVLGAITLTYRPETRGDIIERIGDDPGRDTGGLSDG